MDHYEKYSFSEASSNLMVYEFISFGPKGFIKKIVEFTETADENVFNLCFGNRKDDGSIDDLTTNDNRDRNKVLATVATIAADFLDRHPDYYVFFSGSTEGRTRLYRMAISINYHALSKTFKIWGLYKELGFETLNPTRTYKGFLIKRK